MSQLRRLLPLVLCFSLCLTVCVLPVSAGIEGVMDYSGTPFYFKSGYTYVYPLQSLPGNVYMSGNTVELTYPIADCNGCYQSGGDYVAVEVYPAPGTYNLENVSLNAFLIDANGNMEFLNTTGWYSAYVDGTSVNSWNKHYGASFTATISSRLEIRFKPTYDSSVESSNGNCTFMLQLVIDGLVSGGASLDSVIDSIKVQTGTIEEIADSVETIETVVSNVEVDISDLKDTIQDTHDQLEDPGSNIWQAAGETISNAVESLFVPSAEDITEVKQGFDDLAKDKLGGAYTAMETVDDTITQVNDKLNNPSAAEGIEFPGISVPLGGEVGTVTLAEKQMVTLPTALTAVLHPLAGTIISIICGLGTFNVLKDMVECFLSGYSFAEYLHRNKGGSDE